MSPGGELEALLEWDPGWSPRYAAIVCHPHPLYGGTMHNKVVYRAAKAALAARLPVLRFNFRGVGRSLGNYAGGIGERADARAALDYLTLRFPDLPVCMLGFSFGSGVGLFVGVEDPRVDLLVGLGLPVGSTPFTFLEKSPKPKLIVQGTQDTYGPRERLQTLFDSLQQPKELYWVENADHFFTGKLLEVQSAVEAFILKTLGSPK